MYQVINGIDAIAGISHNMARIHHVLGEDAAPAPVAAVAKIPEKVAQPLMSPEQIAKYRAQLIQDGPMVLGGAAAGAYFYKKHRVLGAIGGASLARNAPALLKDDSRREALCNMGQTGAAIYASQMMKGSPVIGFLIGHLAAGAALHFSGLRK